MATREKRLAQFDGIGEPPPNQPVEVLCEDHVGLISCRLPAAGSTASGAMKRPAARSRPPWLVGGCRAPIRSETT